MKTHTTKADKIRDKIWDLINEWHDSKPGYECSKVADKIDRQLKRLANVGHN